MNALPCLILLVYKCYFVAKKSLVSCYKINLLDFCLRLKSSMLDSFLYLPFLHRGPLLLNWGQRRPRLIPRGKREFCLEFLSKVKVKIVCKITQDLSYKMMNEKVKQEPDLHTVVHWLN